MIVSDRPLSRARTALFWSPADAANFIQSMAASWPGTSSAKAASQARSFRRPSHAQASADISIIDGGTERSGGGTYRLVGFDLGHCDKERDLAEKVAARLRFLIVSGEASLSARLALADQEQGARRRAISAAHAPTWASEERTSVTTSVGLA